MFSAGALTDFLGGMVEWRLLAARYLAVEKELRIAGK